MKKNLVFMLLVLVLTLVVSCSGKQKADLLLFNGRIHTVNDKMQVVDAMVISDGLVIATGEASALRDRYNATQLIDLEGKNVYPGFIDPHSHFSGYSLNLLQASLWMATSMQEITDRLKQHRETMSGQWLLGRGWDQNLFEVKEMPGKDLLDEVFPDIPVFIVRVDGHAAVANSKALELSGVNAGSRIDGGEVVVKNGRPTGLLIDKAMQLVSAHIPPLSVRQVTELLKRGQQDMFDVGLTSVCDAGLTLQSILLLDSLQKEGELSIRIYAMLNPTEENYNHFLGKGPYVTNHLTVRSIKLYADGALGSRGALMKQPYTDKPDTRGILVDDPALMRRACEVALAAGYQVNTHCIGDSAVSLMLDIYSEYLTPQNDNRWRIEHAQIVDPADMNRFGQLNIVPSIQAIHAVSDMGWAEDRVGAQRIKGAYAFRDLLNQVGWLPNGSDFPVEQINPLFSFHAAISRTDDQGMPKGGWYPDQLLTREEALRAMTIWAAKANFEENTRGSLEQGKFADFVVLNEDLLTVEEHEIYHIKVQETWVEGLMVK
jgi:predicted amidohydrolase YtcJ